MGSPRNVRLVSSRRPPAEPASNDAISGAGSRAPRANNAPYEPRARTQAGHSSRSRTAPVAAPRTRGGILQRIAGAFGALVGAVRSLFQPKPTSRRRHRTHGRGPAETQHLHKTFRSGTAAPHGSSLPGYDGTSELRRAPSRGRGGSVIGQPLSHSSARNRGRGGYRVGHTDARSRRRSPYVSHSAAPSRAPLRPITIAVTSLALAIVLFVGASFVSHDPVGLDPETEMPLLDLPLLNPTAFPVSTDPDAWQAGEMPHLYQTDVRWANLPYGGGTVAKNACGPTVMTMLYVYFTGSKDMDPGTMAAWADYNNYAPTGATEWSFMTQAAAAFGFYGEMVDPTRETIEGALRAGNPVVCVVDPGDFTNVGHFIILKSIDDRAMVEVYDPNSPERSARKWDIVRVLNQTDVAWIYSSY